MAEGKAKRAKYSKDNSSLNAERQRKRVAKNFGNEGKTNFTSRDRRRQLSDFKPVNELASLQQAPEGKFARSLTKKEQYKILGLAIDVEPIKPIEEVQA